MHVPALGEERLVDPTDKRLDLARFPADGLWESHALVLDPERPRLAAPAVRPDDGYRIESRRLVTPAGADWTVEETLTLHGYFASWMRELFAPLGPRDRTLTAQDMLSGSGAVQLLQFRFENLGALAEPAELALTYRVPAAVSAAGTARAAALPAPWEDYYLGTTFVPERRTAFEWPLPLRFASEVVVRLPSEPSAQALEALRKEARSEYCAWKVEPRRSATAARDLCVHFEFAADPLARPAERYGDFHAAWEGARRAWSEPLRWEEKP